MVLGGGWGGVMGEAPLYEGLTHFRGAAQVTTLYFKLQRPIGYAAVSVQCGKGHVPTEPGCWSRHTGVTQT